MNRYNKLRFVLVNASFIPSALGIIMATDWSVYTLLVVVGYSMAVGSNFANIAAHANKENGYG